jgi:hypothetical protein
MKKMLTLASVAEGGFGLLLLAYPPVVAQLLFAAEISGAGVIIGRLTGMCLIALAVACWPNDGVLHAFYGMLTWSVLAMLCLVMVGMRGQAGILLWPAVVIHAAIAVLLLRERSAQRKSAQ